MYKIYINEQLLILSQQPATSEITDIEQFNYENNDVNLLNYINLLEKSSSNSTINIYSQNLEELWTEFRGLFNIMPAAGGIVHSDQNKILAIYRRGHWDLPKGKIEKKESIEDAAVREVEEETGIKVEKLGEKIGISYHCYTTKSGKRVLKPSHWFKMYAAENELTPQTEEDIEKAIWISKDDFLALNEPMYKTIRMITEACI